MKKKIKVRFKPDFDSVFHQLVIRVHRTSADLLKR